MRITMAFLALVVMATSALAQNPYRLQPGDTIEITVYQEPDLGRQVLVGPDGRISFPLAGHIAAAGLTLEGTEQRIKDRLKPFFADELDVTVLLVGADERPDTTVYVTGEVQSPGAFEVKTKTSVLQAIALAGGLNPYAAKHRIVVRRTVKGQELVFPYDYGAAENGWPDAGDVVLHHGDVIVVPERGLFE